MIKTDNHWIKVNQELAELVVLATLPPIEPDFDFSISYKNIWDNGNPTGICQLMQE
jgi:hypothetical protein